MGGRLLVYGATGFTARLITRELLGLGIKPVLAGRDGPRVAAVAGEAGLDHRVASLDDPAGLAAILDGASAVLHTAGPFSGTAMPMAQACLARGVHYLDIAAEVASIEALAGLDAAARRRRITIMPAVGFDVVPSDCLAAHVARRLPGARQLTIALTGLGLVTRGSARTLIETWHRGFERREGALVPTPLGARRRHFDFGSGPRPSVNVSWGDVATAYYTTGIPNVETFCESNPVLETALVVGRSFGPLLAAEGWRRWLGTLADALPEGPSERERAAVEMVIVAEARDEAGGCARARLRTPEAYSFTATTSAAIARRVLRGDFEVGFQTPGRVYGPDFVCGFAGVHREDLD
jgi:short subunit dehydrogenase-like uncharacterized protein